MVKDAINIFKTATSFLQSGVTPPNTPENQQDELSTINFLKSKKFFIVFSSIIALSLFFVSSTFILYIFPQDATKVTGFIAIFTKTIELLSLIVSFYLGIQTVLDYKVNSSSSTNVNADIVSNQTYNKTEITMEYLTGGKEDDYSLTV